VQDVEGNVLINGLATVYLANSDTLATIYDAVSGGNALSNSVVESDEAGKIFFYVDNSDYTPSQRFKVVVSGVGYKSQTFDYLKIIPAHSVTNIVYPEWFGAKGDGTTDDRDAFNDAFQALPSNGGVVAIDTSKQYYIASDITMPKYCSLVGNRGFSMIPREAHEWEDAGNLIYLNGTASLIVSEGGSISGFNMLRSGITLPADKAEVDNFTGTAIRLADHAHQVYIGHMGIAGFQWAIDNHVSGAVTDKTNFNYCENLKVEYCAFDNTNNIRIGNALSTTFLHNIKTGALATVTLAGVVDADYERTGYSFHIAGESDGVSITGCTTYGYQNGYRIERGHGEYPGWIRNSL
jgi:hypothetical protein